MKEGRKPEYPEKPLATSFRWKWFTTHRPYIKRARCALRLPGGNGLLLTASTAKEGDVLCVYPVGSGLLLTVRAAKQHVCFTFTRWKWFTTHHRYSQTARCALCLQGGSDLLLTARTAEEHDVVQDVGVVQHRGGGHHVHRLRHVREVEDGALVRRLLRGNWRHRQPHRHVPQIW